MWPTFSVIRLVKLKYPLEQLLDGSFGVVDGGGIVADVHFVCAMCDAIAKLFGAPRHVATSGQSM
ncbi:hypothetical protein [Bradyrhizobium sp. JYMT SZCCT0428]|uniref:hypothetical protein n=1 Tax=Bradyrhizobium sp. JYMT SZCCT0428 TaxID=2807673 RepID=UPI001BA8C353|nr:hypothetical protein [Bradyrhizobium sp. JYMT SZCCT0428]MBR1154061.1 hypothetical protein [Bradyrhizobium sp. JYMT SZCCT0428]